jgi:hypothetical protein
LPRSHRFVLAIPAAVALLLLAAACSSEAVSNSGPATTEAGAAIVLSVTRGGDTIETWTLAALLALPQQEVEMDGDLQTGPWLRDVLQASSVGDRAHATVVGAGESRAFDVELAIESGPADGYILDITRRGTAKLAGPDLPRERWVRDVTEIRIDD